MRFNSKKNQSGQAVLIVLLSLSVVLIIVLYIMSRSVTDISISNKEDDSMRAFSAAEAGIERALVIGSGGTGVTGDANFSASVSDFGKDQSQVVYPMSLKSGEIATFWFSRPNEASFTGNSVSVCWGSPSTGTNDLETPAVEMSTYYLDSGVYKISRAALDPNPLNPNRPINNNFTSANNSTCTIDGEKFQFQKTITLPTSSATLSLQFATIKILYNNSVSHKIGIDVGAGNKLPSQGVKINSDGSFANANRSIEVYQLHPVAPAIFMNSVFSARGVTK